MSLRLITRRYGEAFAAHIKETIGLETAIAEIKCLKNIITQNPEFAEILQSPEITVKEKFQFINDVLGNNFSQEIILFLKFLIEKRRIGLLTDILDYIRVNYSHGEAVEAVMRSAYPLDLEAIQKIKKKLEKRLGKKLFFYLELDADLLGGVQVTVGNKVIDGTLRRRLDELKNKVMAIRMG